MTGCLSREITPRLEASFLIRRLPPSLKQRSSRLVKSREPHFTDSGPAAHLAGIATLEPCRDDLLRGALFETCMLSTIRGAFPPGFSA